MLARADGGQAVGPRSPAPVFHSPPTTYHMPPTSFVFSNILASFGQKRKFSSRLVGFLGRQDKLSE